MWVCAQTKRENKLREKEKWDDFSFLHLLLSLLPCPMQMSIHPEIVLTSLFSVVVNVLWRGDDFLLILTTVINNTSLAGKHLVHNPEDRPQPKEHERLENQEESNDGVVCRLGVVLASVEGPGIDDVAIQEMASVDPDEHETCEDGVADAVGHSNVL